MFYMFFNQVVVVFTDRAVDSLVGDQAAFVERIFIGVIKANQFIVHFEFRHRQRRGEFGRCDRILQPPFEIIDDYVEFFFCRCFVEATDAAVDRMDFTTTQQDHQVVADFLETQGHFDQVGMVTRHLDAVFVAQEIRCVQHEHVEDVAFDPFAAVD